MNAEPRPTHLLSYCAATDPRHGVSCWSTQDICRDPGFEPTPPPTPPPPTPPPAQVERELQPITCGQTVTVTVAGDNDFFPFMLDLTLATGNKRLDFHTCSSPVRDPDVRTHRCARSLPRLACVRACSSMHPKSRTRKGW